MLQPNERLTRMIRNHNRPVDLIDIVLFDMFGEGYTHPLHDPTYRADYARTWVLLDLFHAGESIPGGVVVDTDQLAKSFDGFDSQSGWLILVSGTQATHKRLWDELYAECIVGPHGADDDTFDYWPGALDTLEDYATDLTACTADGHYYRQLRALAKKFEPKIDDWEFEAYHSHLMELTKAVA